MFEAGTEDPAIALVEEAFDGSVLHTVSGPENAG